MNQKPIRFSPYGPAFQENPFRYYTDLIEKGPVHRTRTGVYIVVGYDECRRILSDARFLRAPEHRSSYQTTPREKHKLKSLAARILLNLDYPEHGIVRDAFSLPFSNKNVLRYENLIREKSRCLIQQIPDTHEVDLVSNYASPLTVFSIKNLIGLEKCSDDTILNFARKSIHFLEFRAPNAQEVRASEQALDELFVALKLALRDPKKETFLHTLANSVHKGVIDEETALSNLAFLISAGFETTIGLLCGGFHLLCSEESQGVIESKAVFDEVLRLAPPIHLTSRIAGEDILLGKTEFKRGHSVIVAIAAACRDPSVYELADSFLPERKKPASLSFGMGAHYCLGVNLARLEARIGWDCLFEKFGHVPASALDIQFENRAAIRTPSRLILRT